MDDALCKLTLVYPPAIEDVIVDMLLTAEPPIYGFTTWTADGHGLDFGAASANEKVRGRIRRGIMILVLSRQRLPRVIELLKQAVNVAGLAYWVEPVERFERLTYAAHEPSPPTAVDAASDAQTVEPASS